MLLPAVLGHRVILRLGCKSQYSWGQKHQIEVKIYVFLKHSFLIGKEVTIPPYLLSNEINKNQCNKSCSRVYDDFSSDDETPVPGHKHVKRYRRSDIIDITGMYLYFTNTNMLCFNKKKNNFLLAFLFNDCHLWNSQSTLDTKDL